jgi:hypothetical protein
MWMVERQLKSLKAFVRQRAHRAGSMVEGYMVYQCMVYISQYLPKLAENMNVACIWNLNSINKFEGEVILGKGKMRTVKGNYYMLV